jgi:hypothetical protein
MVNLVGRRAAILSYRLGMADGVLVTAAQWVKALRRLGMQVRTVAGDGRAGVLVAGLGLDANRPPPWRRLAAALDGVDLVVVDNVCSLPMNRRVGEAVANHLAGRPLCCDTMTPRGSASSTPVRARASGRPRLAPRHHQRPGPAGARRATGHHGHHRLARL